MAKKVPSDNKVEQPPTRASWFPDEKPREPDDPWDPFGPGQDRTKAPFFVNGQNPATDSNLSAEERQAWLTKQHEAMHKA